MISLELPKFFLLFSIFIVVQRNSLKENFSFSSRKKAFPPEKQYQNYFSQLECYQQSSDYNHSILLGLFHPEGLMLIREP